MAIHSHIDSFIHHIVSVLYIPCIFAEVFYMKYILYDLISCTHIKICSLNNSVMLFSLSRIRFNFRRTLDSVGQKVRRHINHKGILYRQVTIVKSDYGMTKLPASSHILPFLDVRYANTKLVSKHQSDLYHISFYFLMFIAKCTCTTFPFQRAHLLLRIDRARKHVG